MSDKSYMPRGRNVFLSVIYDSPFAILVYEVMLIISFFFFSAEQGGSVFDDPAFFVFTPFFVYLFIKIVFKNKPALLFLYLTTTIFFALAAMRPNIVKSVFFYIIIFISLLRSVVLKRGRDLGEIWENSDASNSRDVLYIVFSMILALFLSGFRDFTAITQPSLCFAATVICVILRRHMAGMYEFYVMLGDRLFNLEAVKKTLRFNNKHISIFIVTLLLVSASIMYGGGALLEKFLVEQPTQTVDIPTPTPEPPTPAPTPEPPTPAPTQTERWRESEEPRKITISEESAPFFTPLKIAAIFLSIALIFIIIAVFHGKEPENDPDELKNYSNESEKSSQRRFKIMRPYFLLSPNEKVRRLFYNKVDEHLKHGLNLRAASTSRTIAEDIAEKEDISELEDLYRIARYSGKKLNRESVESLKKK